MHTYSNKERLTTDGMHGITNYKNMQEEEALRDRISFGPKRARKKRDEINPNRKGGGNKGTTNTDRGVRGMFPTKTNPLKPTGIN